MPAIGPSRPIIFDCDPGTDDAVALLLALASPELAPQAITVAGGNAPLARTLANAEGLVALAGADVPVYAGAACALLGPFPAGHPVHGTDGVGGVRLPAGKLATPGVAADTIRAILRRAADPVTLVGIGPATNLALALATEPALAARVARIALMSGAWSEGNATPAAEFNAWCDPEALAIVCSSSCSLTLATLEIGLEAMVTPARIAALRAAGSGRALAAACDILASLPPSQRLRGEGTPLYDPAIIAWLVRPSLFATRECAVRVDCGPGPSRGRTVIDRWGRTAPNAILLERLDVDGFFALLAERLARLP